MKLEVENLESRISSSKFIKELELKYENKDYLDTKKIILPKEYILFSKVFNGLTQSCTCFAN